MIHRLQTKPALRIVSDDTPTERVFGSPSFIGRTRNTALRSPERFEPTKKEAGDVVI